MRGGGVMLEQSTLVKHNVMERKGVEREGRHLKLKRPYCAEDDIFLV